jgi:hypothetical protein
MTTKRELKMLIKAKRLEIEALGGISPYVSLQLADEEEMSAWLIEAENVLAKYKQRIEDDDVEGDSVECEDDLSQINKAKTLKQLLDAIKDLSQKGSYKDWEFTPWTKNGQCRIYAKDISYSNPKTRGYFLVNNSGKVEKIEESRNNPLPDLPTFPRKFYHNDIISEDGGGNIETKVSRYLKSQFPDGNWTGQDYDDACEMFGGR